MEIFIFYLPYFVLLAIVVTCVSIIWLSARQLSNKYPRSKIWFIGLVITVLIPTWDVILGRAYFYSLCKVHGGAAILKQVE